MSDESTSINTKWADTHGNKAELVEAEARIEPVDKSSDETSSDSSDSSDESTLEAALNALHISGASSDTSGVSKVLPSPTIESVASYIKSGGCRKIIVMTGAGVSVAAGIPDFRTPGTGLYYNLQKYNLPYPTAVFEINYFQSSPEPFYLLAKELYPGNFDPTPAHYFIKLLNDKGLLLRNYTQNIDTLERCAGIPADVLVEAHGSFATAHCIKCKKEHAHEWVKEHVFAQTIPRCTACSEGLVKPDIVFFW
jgi:hypothetical protein